MTLSVFLFRPLEPNEEVGALLVDSKAGWRVYEVARIQPVKNERTVLPTPAKVNNLEEYGPSFCGSETESVGIMNSSGVDRAGLG